MGDAILNIDTNLFNNEITLERNQFKVVALRLGSVDVQDDTSIALLQKIKCASSVEDQVKAIKGASHVVLKNSSKKQDCLGNEENFLSIAIELYLSAPAKHPLKKSISKIVGSLRDDQINHCNVVVRRGLTNRMETGVKNSSFHDLKLAVSALLSTFEGLCVGPSAVTSLLNDVLLFLDKSLALCCGTLRISSSSIIKLAVSKLAHSTLRIVILILQNPAFKSRNISGDFEKEKLCAILRSANCLMINNDIPFDTRSICGLVIILILDVVQGSKGWMQLLSSQSFKTTNLVEIKDQVSSISICSGFLCGLQPEQLLCLQSDQNQTVFSCVFNIILDLNAFGNQESCIILGVWRLLQQFTRIMTTQPALVLSLSASQFDLLVNYLWSQLDHYMDTVKHLSRSVLDNLAQSRDSLLSIGFDLCEKVKETVAVLPRTRRGPYVILDVMASHIGAEEVFHMIPNLVVLLLTSMQCPSASSYSSSAFTSIVAIHIKEVPESRWIQTWALPLLKIMQSKETHDIVVLECALSRILQLCPAVLKEVISSVTWTNSQCPSHFQTLLTCLKISRKLGSLNSFCKETDDDGDIKLWHNIIPISILHSALVHHSDELRLTSLSLIIETNKSTEAVLREDFDLFKYFLEYNINHDVPATRQQSLALIFKLLVRLKESAPCLQRFHANLDKCANDLLYYKNFLSWLTSFCFQNLGFGSNFSRRICSLKILTFLFDTFKMNSVMTNSEWECLVFTEEHSLSLLGIILMDTFEENKGIATSALASFPPETIGLLSNSNIKTLCQSGLQMAANVHPACSSSAAYIMELSVRVSSLKENISFKTTEWVSLEDNLFKVMQCLKVELEKELHRAKKSLFEAAYHGPMYGSLFCVRHLLKLVPDLRLLEDKVRWRNFISEMVVLCLQISFTVSSVVNNSSPEGHLPMDFSNVSNSLKPEENMMSIPFKATAQMVLLCSWRTVKEISLLFGELSDRCTALTDDEGIFAEGLLLSIGDHLIKLLEETKHRGAFEQAYVGFSLLAACLWRHPKDSLHSLPYLWLDDLLNAIQSAHSIKSKLCSTRRSAGVPFLVQALVTTEIQTGCGSVSLQKTMTLLLCCASAVEKPTECRTHALNILRTLFRHAPLAEHVTPFVCKGFLVAISGFRGKTWAERNSATLLFSSLMTRVFGVRRSRESVSLRNKMTGHMFFHRYPELYGYILTELERAVAALYSENAVELATLYPILLLLARLYPSSLEGTDSSMELSKFVPWVKKCAGSSVFKTRIAAAKAVVPLISVNLLHSYVESLIDALVAENKENMLHGLLLQVIQLFKNTSMFDHDQLKDFCSDIGRWISKLLKRFCQSCSFAVLEMFLQSCEMVAENWYSSMPLTIWSSVEKLLLLVLKYRQTSSSLDKAMIGLSVLEARAARLLLHLFVLKEDKDIDLLVLELSEHQSYEVVQETLLFLEHILSNSSVFQLDEEEESVLFDAMEKQEFWVKRLPFESVTVISKILYESKRLALRLSAMVDGEQKLKIRMTLRSLSHMAPYLWHQNINVSLLVQEISSDHEASSCAALLCFSSLLGFVANQATNISEDHSKLLEAGCKEVPKLCFEERSVSCRTVAVNFLLQHRSALERQYIFLKDETVCELWMAALKLIHDEDLYIRGKAACLVSVVPQVPKKSEELLLKDFVEVMGHSSMCESTLIAMGLGILPDLSIDDVEERVFDKGEMNIFHECDFLTKTVCKYLSAYSKKSFLTEDDVSWISFAVCGNTGEKLSSARDLFKYLRCLICDKLKVYSSEFLSPAPAASFMHRLMLVELALTGCSEWTSYDCLPFQWSKLISIKQ